MMTANSKEATQVTFIEERAGILTEIFNELQAMGAEAEVYQSTEYNRSGYNSVGNINKVDGEYVDITVRRESLKSWERREARATTITLRVGFEHIANYPRGKNGFNTHKIAAAIVAAVKQKKAVVKRRDEESTKSTNFRQMKERVCSDLFGSEYGSDHKRDIHLESSPSGVTVKLSRQFTSEEEVKAYIKRLQDFVDAG